MAGPKRNYKCVQADRQVEKRRNVVHLGASELEKQKQLHDSVLYKMDLVQSCGELAMEQLVDFSGSVFRNVRLAKLGSCSVEGAFQKVKHLIGIPNYWLKKQGHEMITEEEFRAFFFHNAMKKS